MSRRSLGLALGLVCAAGTALAGTGEGGGAPAATPRASLRLKESVRSRGEDGPLAGKFTLAILVRGAKTDRLSSVDIDVGDFSVTIPLKRGRFVGRLRDLEGDIQASVFASGGTIHARFRGRTKEGGASVFGARAFEACADSDHWDGVLYGLEKATVSFGDDDHAIAVGLAGRSERSPRQRADRTFDDGTDNDDFRIALAATGRAVAAATARTEAGFVPDIASQTWDGRLRGQVLAVGGIAPPLTVALDGGDERTIVPTDAEALDLSSTLRHRDGVVSREFDGVTVTQVRFDVLLTAAPGPHEAFVRAIDGADREASITRAFDVPENDMPLLFDVDAHALEVRADGLVWAWGENGNGVVGDGTAANPVSPVPLAGPLEVPTQVRAVAASERISLAVDGLGRVWIWGRYIVTVRLPHLAPPPERPTMSLHTTEGRRWRTERGERMNRLRESARCGGSWRRASAMA